MYFSKIDCQDILQEIYFPRTDEEISKNEFLQERSTTNIKEDCKLTSIVENNKRQEAEKNLDRQLFRKVEYIKAEKEKKKMVSLFLCVAAYQNLYRLFSTEI